MRHPEDLSLGGWRIDLSARTATDGAETRHLSPRAIRLLSALAHAQGATLSRVELLDTVWPDVIVSDESLTQVVSEVRRVLSRRDIITTISRGGYRLGVPAEHVASPGAPMLASTATHQIEPSVTDLEAHALCLEAREEIVQCGPGAIERAEGLTAHAVDLSPMSSMVHAERAVALVRSHLYWSDGRALLDAGLYHAERSVDLDPASGAAQSCLGYAHATAGNWSVAEAAHQRAIALEPNSASCFHLAAWYLMTRRRIRAAVSFFERVGDLEPGNIKGYLHAAQLSKSFDPQRARRNAEKALKRARTRLETNCEDMRALAATALVMSLLGEPGSAFRTIESADTSGSAQGIYVASALALLGDTDRAILHIEELFDHGWRDMPWLDVDPAFEHVVSDHRFKRLRSGSRAA